MATKEVKLIISGNGRGAVSAINEVEGAGKRLHGGMVDLSSVMYSTFGPALAGLGVVAIAKQMTDAAIASQKMTNSMIASTGSATVAADELEFVRTEANRLGIDLLTSAESYTKLTAAAKGTNLEGQATRDIFTAVSGAATSLGLRAEETQGALNAIQQMMSKGTVQAEELCGQLGERLPGAFNIAARSMGVTTAELGKMLEKGKVVAEDFLPKFAAELKKTFEPTEAMTHSAAAEINRFNTSLYNLKVAVMDGGGIDALTGLVTVGTAFVNITKDGIRLLAEEKMMLQQFATEISIIMDGGDFGRNWLLPAGRAELKAELDAAEQMYQYSWNKIQQRYGNAPGIVPPGDFVGPPEKPPGWKPPKKDPPTGTVVKVKEYDDPIAGAVDDFRAEQQYQLDVAAQYREIRFANEAEAELFRQESSANAREIYFAGLDLEKKTLQETEDAKRFEMEKTQEVENNLMQYKMQNAQMSIDLLMAVAGKSKAIAMAGLVVTKGLAMAETFISTQNAAAAALAPPPLGLGPVLGAPLAAGIETQGYIRMGLIAATGLVQAASMSGGGQTSLATSNGGTFASPFVTQPVSLARNNEPSITVQIMGNVIGQDKWVEEQLVPALRDLGRRNITITA